MTTPKTIILCADDFGLNEGVSEGILKLVSLRRLSAVSCMVNVKGFGLYAKALLAFQDRVQIGLHFNLTDGALLSAPNHLGFGLKELLLKTHLRLISTPLIAQELDAQLDHFIQLTGRYPDFIDGHQHIHQFPGIRPLFLDFYERRLKSHNTFIRSTYPAISLPQYAIKTNLLAFTGGWQLTAQLRRMKLPHNAYFSGIYDFSADIDYRSLFRKWLRLAKDRTLIMCHPGEGNHCLDPISLARIMEFSYFSSALFLSDLNEFNECRILQKDQSRTMV